MDYELKDKGSCILNTLAAELCMVILLAYTTQHFSIIMQYADSAHLTAPQYTGMSIDSACAHISFYFTNRNYC